MNKDYEIKCQSFSNFLESNGQSVQNESVRSSGRKDALDYAHPIDAKIIRILDNPVVNQVFSKLVNLGTDMSYGLVLSTGIRMDNRPSEITESLQKCAETNIENLRPVYGGLIFRLRTECYDGRLR